MSSIKTKMKHTKEISNSTLIKTENLEAIAYVALASGGTAFVDGLKVGNYFGVGVGIGKVLLGNAAAVASSYRDD